MNNIISPNASAKTAMAIAIRNNVDFKLYHIQGHVVYIHSTGITNPVSRMWGDTYPIRSFLREKGWEWDKEGKCWVIDEYIQHLGFQHELSKVDYTNYINPLTSQGWGIYISIVQAELSSFDSKPKLFPLFWAMVAEQIGLQHFGGSVYGRENVMHKDALLASYLETSFEMGDKNSPYNQARAWARSFIDKPSPGYEVEDTDA